MTPTVTQETLKRRDSVSSTQCHFGILHVVKARGWNRAYPECSMGGKALPI